MISLSWHQHRQHPGARIKIFLVICKCIQACFFGFSFMGFPPTPTPRQGQYLNRKKRFPAGLLSSNKLCKLCNIFLGYNSAGGLPHIPEEFLSPHTGALCCLRLWEVNQDFAQGNIFSLCEVIKEEYHLNQMKWDEMKWNKIKQKTKKSPKLTHKNKTPHQSHDLYLESLQKKDLSYFRKAQSSAV